jgi:hypothetical protein
MDASAAPEPPREALQDQASDAGDSGFGPPETRQPKFLMFECSAIERLANFSVDADAFSNAPRERGYPAAMPVSFIAGTGHLRVYRQSKPARLG